MAKILITDDQEDVRALLRFMLETLGHEVTEATDGADALARVQIETFDVIMLDVQMPGVGGYEVLEALRDIAGFDTPVIMVTGQNEPHEILKEAQRGALERVAKPFTIGELQRTLERVLAMSDDERLHRKQDLAQRAEMVDSMRDLRETMTDDQASYGKGRHRS